MNLIDKIINWLDAFGKFKKRINTWYYLKDTQIAFIIILFLVIIFAAFYAMFKSNFNWYWSLLLLLVLVVGGVYALVRFTLNERKNKRASPITEVETIGLDFNKIVLDNIYYVLRGFEKIDVSKTSIDDFHAVLTKPFNTTDSEIHFIATNWVEIRYILEKFKESSGTEYSTFEKSNKLFIEGKRVTGKKLSNNGLRKNPDKHFTDKINNCFPK